VLIHFIAADLYLHLPMKRKLSPYLAFAFLLLQSCFENDSAPTAPCYPSSYYESTSSYVYQESYTYDKANHLSLVYVSYNSSASPSSSYNRTTTYQSDAEGKLIKITYNDGSSTGYAYNNGKVISVTNYSSTNQVSGKQEYTYNNNSQCINRLTYSLVNGVLTKGSYYVYEYSDTKSKNFTKRSFFNSAQVLQSTSVYSYDTKQNPDIIILPNTPLVPSNNITKIVTTPASGGTASTYTYQFNYTSSGYPSNYKGGYTANSDSYSYQYNNCSNF
jgi:hypothetical protein